jgi:hypothetical protein
MVERQLQFSNTEHGRALAAMTTLRNRRQKKPRTNAGRPVEHRGKGLELRRDTNAPGAAIGFVLDQLAFVAEITLPVGLGQVLAFNI